MSLLPGLQWVSTSAGSIPDNAVEGGVESDGAKLYVARAKNDTDDWTPGKAGRHLPGCHYPHSGKERIAHEYEVLTIDPDSGVSLEWRYYAGETIDNTEDAICMSETLFVARGTFSGSIIPGKFDSSDGNIYMSYGGHQFSSASFQILYQKLEQVEMVLMSRSLTRTIESPVAKPNWVRTSGYNIPSNAIKCGYETDGKVLYVAKAVNPKDGQWTPGKAGYHLPGCHIPYYAEEITVSEYEVLTREPNEQIVYEWRNYSGGNFPDKERAICTSTEKGLYVARGIYDGSLIPGKIAGNVCYVPFGGGEFTCDPYDILYQIQLTGDNDPDYEEQITQYIPHLHDLAGNLRKGIPLFSKYATDLKAGFETERPEISFIRDVLFPTINKAKMCFNEVVKVVDNLVNMISTDVETCVHILQEKSVAIKDWERRLAELKVELDGKSRHVENEEQRVNDKQRELDKAYEALETAQNKLDQAEEARKTAKIVGGILFIFGPLGWIAGSATLITDATALRRNVESCEEIKESAKEELLSSQKSLDQARSDRRATEYRLSEMSRKKIFQESHLKDLRNAVDSLKEYQKKITDLDVKVKNVDFELTTFYSNVEVLLLETDGGYSLDLLQKPTMKVFDALSKLLHSKSARMIFRISEIKEMETELQEVREIKWPASTD